jgi:hypothetical protein
MALREPGARKPSPSVFRILGNWLYIATHDCGGLER